MRKLKDCKRTAKKVSDPDQNSKGTPITVEKKLQGRLDCYLEEENK